MFRPPPPATLHHRLTGHVAAKKLLDTLAQAWLEGLPLKTVRKVLRKQGIHPWSLVFRVDYPFRTRMARELRIPDWALRGFGISDEDVWAGQVSLKGLQKGQRLPDGLVLDVLELKSCPHLLRLPWGLRADLVNLEDCRALRRVHGLACRPDTVYLSDCPSLRGFDLDCLPQEVLEFLRCGNLRALPALPWRGTKRMNLPYLTLRDCPKLVSLCPGGVLQGLEVDECRRLRSLAATRVRRSLTLNGCGALESLPRLDGPLEGHVTDCPRLQLGENPLALPPSGSSLRLEPQRGRCSLPPILPMPGLQPVVTPSLPLGVMEEDDPWPWPPVPRVAEEPGMGRVLSALGLSPLDQVACQPGPRDTFEDGLLAALSRTQDPPKALGLVLDWLVEIVREKRLDRIQAVLQAAARFDLTPPSIWMALPWHDREKIRTHLSAFWGQEIAPDDHLEELAEGPEGILGPLVLEGPLFNLSRALGPRSIEGPVWAAGNLTIERCSELEALPEVMVVRGDFHLLGCPGLRRFPRRLEVGGNLRVSNLPRLDRSICRARVAGSIEITNTPALQLVGLGSLEQ